MDMITKRLLFNVFDNTHISDVINCDYSYKSFCLPYEILSKMYISFTQNFEEYDFYGITTFELTKNCINDVDIIKKILNIYLSNIDIENLDETSFKQISLLNNLHNCVDSNEAVERWNYISELILNTNKYKKIFIEQLSIQMNRFNYDTDKIAIIKEINELLYKEWLNCTTRSIIAIRRKRELFLLPKIIYTLENKLYKHIYDFYDMLLKETKDNVNTASMISIDDGYYSFTLSDGKNHNWWLEDNCPKICLLKGTKCQNIQVVTSYLLDRNTLESEFQFGIYVKTYQNKSKLDKSYFLGFDSNNKIVLDVIGECNDYHELNYSDYDEFFIKVVNNSISCGIVVNYTYKELLFSEYIDCSGMIDVGFACKSWGNGKYLHVDFFDTKVICDDKVIDNKDLYIDKK